MPDDPRVQQLLEELLTSHASPEEVCSSCVELLPVVRERWRRMCRARAELEAMFPPEASESEPAPDAASLPVIPGYEVESLLGLGGMGVVFRARHLRLNRVVALKTALAGAYAGPQERERFQREAEAVASLRHPNVVQIHEVGDFGGRPYFTMEYVEGGSLAQKLDGAPLPAREAAALLATLAGAVQSAHSNGIIHRDLKPANVLLTSDGTAKVGDFGLARRLGGEAGLTRTGAALGTPSYMAPEQARGAADAAGPAADVYALGAILYELLTGRPPFRAESAAETIQQVLAQDPAPPSRLNAKVPRDLETICLKCLHKEPQFRYASAAALADDLNRFLRGETIAARPEGPLSRLGRRVRRRPFFSAAVAVAMLSTVALVGGGLWTISERSAAHRAATADHVAMERALDGDLTEMEDHLRKSAWPAARAALERARGRLGDRDPADLPLRLDRGARDLTLADRLDTIRLGLSESVEGRIDQPRCDRTYEKAFREAGFGQVFDGPDAVAGRLQASNISTALLAALDHWAETAHDQTRKGWVLDVARRADPAPTAWRIRARTPAVRDDQAALAKLIETAPVAEETMSLLLALASDNLQLSHQQRLPFLRRIHQAHPGDFWANLSLGYAFMAQNQPGEAARFFQAATAIRPHVAIGYNNLGVALLNLSRDNPSERLAELLWHFRRATELDPQSAAAHLNYGHVLTGAGRIDEAIAEFERTIRLDPNGAAGFAQLGLCLDRMHRFAEAEAALRRGAFLKPERQDIQAELRGFLFRRGRPKDARVAWREALAVDPPEYDAWYGYAELCLFLGEEEEYIRARNALLDKFCNVVKPYLAERTGRACLLLPVTGDDLRMAVVLAERAAAVDRVKAGPTYPYFQFVKGLAEYRQGRFEQAITVMRGDAARISGPSARLVLAMALHRSGREAEARKELAAAVVSHDWRENLVRDQDDWIRHILRREAEALILPKPRGLSGG